MNSAPTSVRIDDRPIRQYSRRYFTFKVWAFYFFWGLGVVLLWILIPSRWDPDNSKPLFIFAGCILIVVSFITLLSTKMRVFFSGHDRTWASPADLLELQLSDIASALEQKGAYQVTDDDFVVYEVVRKREAYALLPARRRLATGQLDAGYCVLRYDRRGDDWHKTYWRPTDLFISAPIDMMILQQHLQQMHSSQAN